MEREFSLYVISTPIGNLQDITLRALECLKNVDYILCEDTRTSVKLLNHFGIKKRLVAYHKFNEMEITENIISDLLTGEKAALISDAGTPLISDPGNYLVKALIENDIDFCVLPGANALLPAVILSGLYSKEFTFIGFLPKKNNERIRLLSSCLASNIPCIIYVSPHELSKVLDEINTLSPKRKLSLSKELTKLHEHTYRGCANEIMSMLQDNIKGEYTMVIDRAENTDERDLTSEADIKNMFETFVSQGIERKTALAMICEKSNLSKKEIYALVMKKD